uniref:Transposase n=1 Tax=Klebsiella pneumoniae TaxID=573 RepID=A0A8B0SUZ5_KLEPN|nr:Putative transposase [Klebsiella pneumoniae]
MLSATVAECKLKKASVIRKVTAMASGSDLHGTKKKSRLEILLLLAALVNWFHYLLGSAAEKAGLHLRYQANTVKKIGGYWP